MNQAQLLLAEVRPEEVGRKVSLGGAIELCLELGGLSAEKTARDELAKRGLVVDKGQFSRWKDGSEGVLWPKIKALMSVCGNEAPLLWMAHDCGFDLHSMHKRETELQRENRLLREQNNALITALRGGRP